VQEKEMFLDTGDETENLLETAEKSFIKVDVGGSKWNR